MITQERLKELFDYQDGQLIWKVKKAQCVKIGSVAGWANRGRDRPVDRSSSNNGV